MNTAAKKALKITGIVIGSIVGLLLLLYAVLWIVRAAVYGESTSARETVCKIPDLGKDFVPQGIGHSEETDTYIMTGYHGKNDQTMMYLVKDGSPRRVRLNDDEGGVLIGHGGGVTCTKDYVYIANSNKLWVYSLTALIDGAESGDAVSPLGIKPVDNTAAFVFSDSTRLFVGEFYRAGNYETDEAHHVTTPSGEINRAIVSCYPLDESGAITADYPDYAISVTGLVQGFAVKDGTYMLSRSYGLTNSSLEYYTAPLDNGDAVEISFKHADELGTKTIPLYILDQSCKFKTLTLPSFSEDLAVVNGRVIVTTEAACNKYIIGKLFGANKVYSYPIYEKD